MPSMAMASALVRLHPDHASETGLYSAQNGVPVIELAKPSSSGLSHNRFLDYSVDSKGLILNNSLQDDVSQLGGLLSKNRLYDTQSASKVYWKYGKFTSSLSEITEVFGDSAYVI